MADCLPAYCLLIAVCSVKPLLAICSKPPLQEFGRDAACEMVNAAPGLLPVPPSLWRRNLAVMRLCGVADPHAVSRNCAKVLELDWPNPALLANLLALQRYAPGQLTAAQVIDSWASYVAGMSAQKLTARLLFLEQLGLLPRLVPTKGPARREWRRQRGLPANSRAAGEPAFISVRDLSVATPADFAGVVAAAATQQPCEPVSSSSIAAFQAGLPQLAAWQQLWAQAEEMSQELRGQLPQQLLPAAEAPVASL